MNYSIHYPGIMERYLGDVLVIIIVIIASLVGLVKLIIEHRRDQKEFDYVVVIVVSILMLIVFYMFGGKLLMDMPNAINQKYEIAMGTAIDFNTAGTDPEERGFHLRRDDDGEIVHIVAIATSIQKGDRLSVIYLQHSGIGAIVKRFD